MKNPTIMTGLATRAGARTRKRLLYFKRILYEARLIALQEFLRRIPWES